MRLPPTIDYATGLRVCGHCWADISDTPTYRRYCSRECCNRAGSHRQRERAKAARRGA